MWIYKEKSGCFRSPGTCKTKCFWKYIPQTANGVSRIPEQSIREISNDTPFSNGVDLPPIVLCNRRCPEKLGRNGSGELYQRSWKSRAFSDAKRGHDGGQAATVPVVWTASGEN